MKEDWKPFLGILAFSAILWTLVIMTRKSEEISIREKGLNNQVTFIKYG